MNVPIILDTCTFFDKTFLFKLKTYHGEKIIPAVAYAELCMHFIKNKRKDEFFVHRLLSRMDIKIEELDANKARYAAKYCEDANDFKKHNRDYFIGAHAWPPPKTMITKNVKDFIFLGKIKVYDPWDFCNKYRL